MKFSDITQFTRGGSYEINVSLKYIDKTITEWEQEGLQLNPDFQRGHIWTDEQQIAFLEYYLRGGKSGMVIYFNNPSWQRTNTTPYNDFVCVDGLQRLTACRRFTRNEIPIFGYYYNEFESTGGRAVDNMKFNVNELQTKAAVLQWYIEMNSGGTPHTTEEIERVKKLLKETHI